MKRDRRWVLFITVAIMVGLMIVGGPVRVQAQADGEPLAPVSVGVNNPAADATDQDTQSTSAVVAAGGTVVSVYNDSGSCLPACGGLSKKRTGWSRSTNGGASFSDMGTLPSGTSGDGGNPVLARHEVTGVIHLVTETFDQTGLACFRSTDSGATWSSPVDCTNGFGSGPKKPWIAVDNGTGPGNANVYVAFDYFGGIGLRRSTDGGATYSNPVQFTLPFTTFAHGSNVVVGTDHSVYVFALVNAFLSDNRIEVVKSTDQGVNWSGPYTVADDLNTSFDNSNGDLGLAGGFRTNSFPQAAVNPVSGEIYAVYNYKSGTEHIHINLRRSTDGTSWGVTTSCSTPECLEGVAHFASSRPTWSPSIAMADGLSQRIMITAYTKPAFTTTGNIIHRIGTFVDGAAFTEITNDTSPDNNGGFAITTSPFPIVVGQDPQVDSDYMGDYDQMDADVTYFYNTWGDNSLGNAFHANQPDVRFAKFYVAASDGTNVAATLPLSRSHTLGSGVLPTAFASIINTGAGVAAACHPAPPSSPPAGLGTFSYQTTNSANVPIGTPNTPANIGPGAVQTYVFGFVPTATIPPETSLAMRFECANVPDAAQYPGVNNFIIRVDSSPVPDTIALISTVSNDGVVRIPGPAGIQLFAIGTSNVGDTGIITVYGNTGTTPLPLTLTVCETNPILGTCLAPPTPSVTVFYLAGTSRSFAFFAQASGSIPFLPQTLRVYSRLVEGFLTTDPLVGATSAAVCTVPNPGC